MFGSWQIWKKAQEKKRRRKIEENEKWRKIKNEFNVYKLFLYIFSNLFDISLFSLYYIKIKWFKNI